MALALFDLDETLIHGDCASLWSAWMARIGWVAAEDFPRRDQALMALYGQGRLAMEDYMAFSLEPLVGRPPEEVAEVVRSYLDAVIAPRFYPDARNTVAAHRQGGDRLLVISASAAFLVQPIAAYLGIEEVLAIYLEVVAGRYTGRTSGVLTYREGKVIRLEQWLQEQHESLVGASFYSDSRNDLALLTKVDNPIAVNPDEVLLEHSIKAKWKVVEWNLSSSNSVDSEFA